MNSNIFLNFSILKGHRLIELDDRELSGLDRIYREANIHVHDLCILCDCVPDFTEIKTSIQTEDRYPWFAGISFKIDGVEVMVLFPWPQDMRKNIFSRPATKGKIVMRHSVDSSDGKEMKRTITVHYKMTDDGKVDENNLREKILTIIFDFSETLKSRFGVKDAL